MHCSSPQHHQYISQRSHDDHVMLTKSRGSHTTKESPDILSFPSLEEEINSILSETTLRKENTRSKDHAHLVTPPYCIPLLPSSRMGLSQQFPAHSCEHVRHMNRTALSGYFWIDPNLGCSADAIRVYCNFTANRTCVYPTEKEVSRNPSP